MIDFELVTHHTAAAIYRQLIMIASFVQREERVEESREEADTAVSARASKRSKSSKRERGGAGGGEEEREQGSQWQRRARVPLRPPPRSRCLDCSSLARFRGFLLHRAYRLLLDVLAVNLLRVIRILCRLLELLRRHRNTVRWGSQTRAEQSERSPRMQGSPRKG